MPGTKEWIKKAAGDFKSSGILMSHEDILDCAIFHSHQSAEKALKTFLVFAGRPIPKSHDLTLLLMNCIDVDNEFILFRNECIILNPYGFDTRYPNGHFRVDQNKVEEAINMAKRILDFVQKKVK